MEKHFPNYDFCVPARQFCDQIKLTFPSPSTAQNARKGNVITFMQNIPNIVDNPPLNVNELCNALKIIFVGVHISNREHLRKISGVSRQKV